MGGGLGGGRGGGWDSWRQLDKPAAVDQLLFPRVVFDPVTTGSPVEPPVWSQNGAMLIKSVLSVIPQ